MCTVETHERLKRETSEWQALPFVGAMPAYDDERPRLQLELRNCRCGSTLAREVES